MPNDQETYRQCSIEGCDEKHGAKGFCINHYRRQEAKKFSKRINKIDKVKLRTRIINSSERQANGCWNWKNVITWNYGQIAILSRGIRAHRASAFAFNNFDLLSKKLVCHKCDNPICVNPDHLFIGTYSDNRKDMFKKNRGADNRGEKSSSAKLTEKQVKEIRYFHSIGYTPTRLKKKYNMGKNIENIIYRFTWKHI